MQLEIQFPSNQLEIDFEKRLNKVVHVKELVELIACNCGERKGRCGVFYGKENKKKKDID